MGRRSGREALKARLDAARTPLGAAFLLGYALHTFAPGGLGTALLLAAGTVLLLISVPYASGFHRGFALAAVLALAATALAGRLRLGAYVEGMPGYFGIVAVLLVLSMAGYPIRAARYEAQIQTLMAVLTRRGIGVRATGGALGHFLGAVLDVGAFVLVDVISSRTVPKEREDVLKWAARAFSFAPLWTNLNLLTATTIVLTGVAYPALLAVSLPFVLLGLVGTLAASRREGADTRIPAPEPLDRRVAAVLLYPLLLVGSVALTNHLFPELTLTAAIATTVALIVGLISLSAVLALRRTSPLRRLGGEVRRSLVSSYPEFALFGSAGVFVISLQSLGALAPLGDLLSALPPALVAPALAALMALGFVAGIHVIPMVLLLDAAFPLDAGPSPALWAVAILLGSQTALLLTPFSSAVTMLSRLTGLHPLEVGPRRNWRFCGVAAAAAALYLALLTLLLL